jgi:hypothetical protein
MSIWRGIKQRWAFRREVQRQRRLDGRTVDMAAIKEHRKAARQQHNDPGGAAAGTSFFTN